MIALDGNNDKDTSAEAVEAARSVLLELSRLLENTAITLFDRRVVPELLIATDQHPHVGSIDVDLALDHRALQEPGYKTILDLLLSRGYQQDDKQPFIFYRWVTIGCTPIKVQVDLLAGEYQGTGKSRRTQEVQDIRQGRLGSGLAFVRRMRPWCMAACLKGSTGPLRIASIVLLPMKDGHRHPRQGKGCS